MLIAGGSAGIKRPIVVKHLGKDVSLGVGEREDDKLAAPTPEKSSLSMMSACILAFLDF